MLYESEKVRFSLIQTNKGMFCIEARLVKTQNGNCFLAKKDALNSLEFNCNYCCEVGAATADELSRQKEQLMRTEQVRFDTNYYQTES